MRRVAMAVDFDSSLPRVRAMRLTQARTRLQFYVSDKVTLAAALNEAARPKAEAARAHAMEQFGTEGRVPVPA